MTVPTSVGLALSSRPWRGALHRHCRDHEADIAIFLLRSGHEVFDDRLDVVVVDDDTSWLSKPFVTKAREVGLVIVGVHDPAQADGHGATHLERLGVDRIVPSTMLTDELVAYVRDARPEPTVDERFDDLIAPLATRAPVASRRVIAVGGPAGAGATEISIGLAARWKRGRPVLVEVDETHPGLARRLGLGVHPHILTAIEALRGERLQLAVDHQLGPLAGDRPLDGPTLDDCLARPTGRRAPHPFDTIVGLASRDDWSLLDPSDALELVDEAAARWSVAIVRLGPNLERIGDPDRYGASRTAVGRADHVIGVCDASPIGLLRFIDWLADVLDVVGDAPISVVLNRLPKHSSSRLELRRQLRSIVGERVGTIVAVPTDRRVERAAWNGDLVASGAFRRALEPLIGEVSR